MQIRGEISDKEKHKNKLHKLILKQTFKSMQIRDEISYKST